MKHTLENYIYEQILVLEQKQLIQENKVLKGLTTLGLAAAVFFSANFFNNEDIEPEDIVDQAQESQSLSKDQLDQIKKGAKEAQRLISQGTNPKNITIHQKEPGIAMALKTLFMNPGQPTDLELEDLESGKNIPIASVEEVTQEHIDHVFKYTPDELQKYLNTESARNSLTINFGEEEICLLDIGQSELSELMNNPDSKVFKHVGKEVLSRRIQARDDTWAAIEAFSSDYENTWEKSPSVNEIVGGSKESIGIGRAIEEYMKEKNVDAYVNIVVDAFNNGTISDQSQVENFINNTDLDEFASENLSASRDLYRDSEEVMDFLSK